MDNCKDKYDNIIKKLLELIEKEKLLDKVDKDSENILKELNICSDELSKLNDKYYKIRHGVIVDKTSKCIGRAFLLSIINCMLFLCLGINFFSNIWMCFLYVISLVIVFYKTHKKLNNKEYMFLELEQSLEYKELVEQIDYKKRELQKLDLEYERLNDESIELCLETEYLYRMILCFPIQEDVDKSVEVAFENGYQEEMEYAISKKLIRRRTDK